MADSSSLTAGPIQYVPDLSWKSTPVSSSMRRAQFEIIQAGSEEAGELAVFYFGEGQGGSAQANIERWTAQFEMNADNPRALGVSALEPIHAKDEIKITLVTIEGTYLGNMKDGQPHPKKNQAFIGVIFETQKGNVFFRLVGPKETVFGAKASLEQVAQNVRLA